MLGVLVQLKHAPEMALNRGHGVMTDRTATHTALTGGFHRVPKPACEINFKKMCRVPMLLI